MGEKRITIMKLRVDLQCDKCYKKVKKVLCKFPQIRDQIYDEKNDTVTIKVVCCSPEKVRDKLCCEGGGSIKSIEIVELPKPKPPEPVKPKPPLTIAPPEPPKKYDAPPPVVKFPEPVPVSVLAYPSSASPIGLFYEGGLGGPPSFYRRPIYDSYGGSGPCYVGCHCQHLCEEDASACTIT